MASYRDLIHHKDEKISEQWMTGGENEFGRLFQGFDPNKVEGLDVLEWIPKTAVPSFKTVTYPRYTTEIRPKKMKNTGSELLQVAIELTMKAMLVHTQRPWKRSKHTETQSYPHQMQGTVQATYRICT